MDHLSAGDQVHLWMLFRLPKLSADADEQRITLKATAQNAG